MVGAGDCATDRLSGTVLVLGMVLGPEGGRGKLGMEGECVR
jgi:hypothetical protein